MMKYMDNVWSLWLSYPEEGTMASEMEHIVNI